MEQSAPPAGLQTPESPLHVFHPPQPSMPAPRHSRRLVWILGIVVVLGGLGFGGYYAYSKGYLRLPFLSQSGDALVAKMIAALADIKNAQYTMRIDLATEPRDAGATSLLDSTNATTDLEGLSPYPLFDYEELVKAIPTDVSFSGGISVYAESDVPAADANAMLRFDGTYSGGDATVAFDVELRKIKKNVYALVSKFPSLFFFDLSPIKGKWVAIDLEEDFGQEVQDVVENQEAREAIADAQQALVAAIDAKVVTVGGRLSDEVIAGVKSEHYRVEFAPENLGTFYTLLIERRKQAGKDTSGLEDAQKTIQEPKNAQLLQRIAENSEIELWIDPVSSHLRKIQWQLRVVPPDSIERLKGKQLSLQLALTLENVNEKVTVDTPTQTIDYEEATRLVTGITKEQQQFENQTNRIREIRSGLDVIKEGVYGDGGTGAYPAKLEDLPAALESAQKTCEDQAANTNGSTNSSSNLSPSCSVYSYYSVKESDLVDVYTNKPFIYAVDGDDYTLKYEIRLSDLIDSYDKDQYADGTNTATSKDASLEAESKSNSSPLEEDTLEKTPDEQRISDIQQLQTALELYYDDQLTPGYPVKATPGPLSSTDLTSDYLSAIPFGSTPPPGGACTDAQNSYSYQSLTTQGGAACSTAPCTWYSITFCLGSATGGLPAGPAVASPSGMQSLGSQNTNSGTNTSPQNTNTNSETLDTDDDGLTDAEEQYLYDTNPTNPDTDGDGFDDGTEVENGYNPNGTGTLS